MTPALRLFFIVFGRTLLFIFLGLVVFESGLQLRHVLGERFPKQIVKQGSSVLFIGDSVMGNLNDSNSLLSQIVTDLNKRGSKLTVQTEVRGANSSSLMVQKIGSYLDVNPPTVAVIMLGVSDLITQDPRASQISRERMVLNEWLFKSHLFRLFVSFLRPVEMKLIEWSPFYLKSHFGLDSGSYPRYRKIERRIDLPQDDCKALLQHDWLTVASPSESQLRRAEDCNQQLLDKKARLRNWILIARAYSRIELPERAEFLFKRALDQDPKNVNFLMLRAYLFFGQNKFKEAIKDFEAAYAETLPNRRAALTLGSCYQKTKQFKRGSEFFSKLAVKAGQEPNLFSWISESLLLLAHPETVDSLSMMGEDQDYYHAQMLFAKMKDQKDMANDLYRRRSEFASTGDGTLDLLNYRKLLSLLLEKNVRVLLMQYPHQPDWPALLLRVPFGENVSFLSLGQIFERHLEKYAVYELFDFDLMHLSEKGTKLLAPSISEKILTVVGDQPK
ncbi:MAG: tetratricopeptide repeat protein [Bdellovibrionales bacterium]